MQIRLRRSQTVRFAVATLLALAPLATLGAQAAALSFAQLLDRPVDAAQMLQPGQPRSGTLDANSLRLEDNSRVQLWYFEGKKGERARVAQRSDVFDTFLALGLHGASSPVAENDDDGGSTNSEIAITLPEDGVYVVIANAYSPDDLGAYSVALELAPPAPGMGGPVTPRRLLLREPTELSRLGVNQRFGSQLDAQDLKMDDGTPFELWHVTLGAGDTLEVIVESSQFAPFLHVGRQGSELVTAQSVHPNRAAVRVVVSEAGVYAIIVGGQTASSAGSYVLELKR
ncbi:MAG TPA: hypothetical protein PK788_04775 [Gemmatimonadaceae bacterium]|nr:hypothetical protein [Gemmatimonadaceae bacterium]HRQ77884.1 hypothetical protein [Gemmatimonadaceae bacterium]